MPVLTKCRFRSRKRHFLYQPGGSVRAEVAASAHPVDLGDLPVRRGGAPGAHVGRLVRGERGTG